MHIYDSDYQNYVCSRTGSSLRADNAMALDLSFLSHVPADIELCRCPGRSKFSQGDTICFATERLLYSVIIFINRKC